MTASCVIFWFRRDLRLADNPGLFHAAQKGRVVPIYILDRKNGNNELLGAASRVWLHYALSALNHSLEGALRIFEGDPEEILCALIKQCAAYAVYWNRCYEPWQIERDKKIKQRLRREQVVSESFNGSLLWEPWEVLKADRTPYKVFTPYYKQGCLNGPAPRKPFEVPPSLKAMHLSIKSADLALLPTIHWEKKLITHWEISEKGGASQLAAFLRDKLSCYKKGRDFPAEEAVSRLSPYLHFGHLSPHQVWFAVQQKACDVNTEHFLSELGWREFSYYLLYHFPKLSESNFQPKFDRFPWLWQSRLIQCWQRGQTGYPLVDAGMRQLIEEGYIHNRVRMVVASFLVKNLLVHWRVGAAWFWDHLVDADLASNSASWQWVAGSGADAAPYFRIFNPTTQGQKFDPEGAYTRRFVPELRAVPNRYLFTPWEVPREELAKNGVILGKTYPLPIVDLSASRAQALEAFEKLG